MTIKPTRVQDDGAHWTLPGEHLGDSPFTGTSAWCEDGNTGVDLVTWGTAFPLTVGAARALADRLHAAADYADGLVAAQTDKETGSGTARGPSAARRPDDSRLSRSPSRATTSKRASASLRTGSIGWAPSWLVR